MVEGGGGGGECAGLTVNLLMFICLCVIEVVLCTLYKPQSNTVMSLSTKPAASWIEKYKYDLTYTSLWYSLLSADYSIQSAILIILVSFWDDWHSNWPLFSSMTERTLYNLSNKFQLLVLETKICAITLILILCSNLNTWVKIRSLPGLLLYSRPRCSPIMHESLDFIPQSTYIYRAPQCMSPRRNWGLSHPLSRQCARNKGGGGSPRRQLEKNLSTLPTLCFILTNNY